MAQISSRSARQQIVSLAPSLTDVLIAIGAAGHLAGVSDYCDLPSGVELPRVGGVGNPDLVALRALEPDAVLIDRSPGAPIGGAPVLSDLPTHSVVARSVAGSIEQTADLLADLGLSAEAVPLLTELRAAVEQAYLRQPGRRLRRVVVFTWRDPWIAVGADTYADDLLRLCGAENIALRLPGRNPRAGLEAFMRYNPQVIVLASGRSELGEDDLDAFWRFGDVEAIRRGRLALCDERLLSRFGPWTVRAIEVLTGLIHG
jgi:iron complex transport system substrate-binding protein